MFPSRSSFARVFFFFFSSRRRHTRYIGDWSSDVCSSDLRRRASRPSPSARRAAPPPRPRRSEERRVGKEGRARGWAEHYKKARRKVENKRTQTNRQERTEAKVIELETRGSKVLSKVWRRM